MNGVEVRPAVDELAALDFEFVPPCHWDDPECTAAATWVGIWPCCWSRVLMCDEHKASANETVERFGLKHKRCGSIVDHLLWLSLPKGGEGRG